MATPVLGSVVFMLVIAAGMIGAFSFLKPTPSPEQVDRMMRTLLSGYFGVMGVSVVIYLSVLLAIWLLLPKRGPASLGSYFHHVSLPTLSFSSLCGLAFAFLVMLTIGFLTSQHVVTFHPTTAEQAITPHDPAQLATALFAIAVVAPIVEEIYFRGLLLRWLTERMPLALAAIPNAALFALIHFRYTSHIGLEGWVLTGGLFMFGLIACALAGTTRSVWPSIVAHGTYNALLIGSAALAVPQH